NRTALSLLAHSSNLPTAPKRKWLLERRACSAYTTQASKIRRLAALPLRCTLLSCAGSGDTSIARLLKSYSAVESVGIHLRFDDGNGRQSHPHSLETVVISLQVAAISICAGRRESPGMVRRVHLRTLQHSTGGEHEETEDWIWGGGGRDIGDEPGTG